GVLRGWGPKGPVSGVGAAALGPLPATRGEGYGVRGLIGAKPHVLHIQLSNSASFTAPSFGRAWGRPVSFPVPPNEGAWRARADARRRNAPVQRATGFSRFRVPRCPDQGQPLVAGGVYPGSARGCSCEPHPRVPAPPHLHYTSRRRPSMAGTHIT